MADNAELPAPSPAPPCVVVMGVSGVGKTTVAQLLAKRLGLPYGEADEFHTPASIAKMSAGIPLDDADRLPWLTALGEWLADRRAAGTGAVITCSALTRRYRDVLRASCPDAYFLHLSGSRELIAARLAGRTGHFMPLALLDSQYAALEPLAEDERGGVLDVGPSPEALAEAAALLLGAVPGGPAAG